MILTGAHSSTWRDSCPSATLSTTDMTRNGVGSSLSMRTERPATDSWYCTRVRLKRNGTRAEIRFRLSAKRTSPFKSAGGRQFSRLLAAEVCASAVVMLDTPRSEVV